MPTPIKRINWLHFTLAGALVTIAVVALAAVLIDDWMDRTHHLSETQLYALNVSVDTYRQTNPVEASRLFDGPNTTEKLRGVIAVLDARPTVGGTPPSRFADRLSPSMAELDAEGEGPNFHFTRYKWYRLNP